MHRSMIVERFNYGRVDEPVALNLMGRFSRLLKFLPTIIGQSFADL